ncbi:phosphotransferase [Streptomyces sp. Tu 6176]|uniref:phosphotransferase n=1 Tax=Streptomyces sp. Tu 6176 TaxID=1470557 RepID=UPI000688569A|nr:phosphotransferase [Streptomyces sp. Tu 6176]
MSTGVDAVLPQQGTAPGVADLFVDSAARIHRAAAGIWPQETVVLERHVPSVTGYVHRVRVGERFLYAKTSVLGVSLVSLLRGAGGPWQKVRREQEAYVRRPDCLLAREAEQLRTLALMDRPRVCAVAGFRQGVLFTEPVPGPTLGELLLTRPGDTLELLAFPFAELRSLHRPGASRRLGAGGVIGERSIGGTFLRKFNGLSGAAYVNQLGAERLERGVRESVAEMIRRSVARLRGLRMAVPGAEGTTLAYGDLKPEHVLFPDGPDGRPVLLDPGLLRTSPMADVAKLVSRTVLLLAAHRPGGAAVDQIVRGIDAFVESRAQSCRERALWHRLVLTLWLMDTVNILSTYLSAPAALPLPPAGTMLVNRALHVCCLVDSASEALADQKTKRHAWELALMHVRAAGS